MISRRDSVKNMTDEPIRLDCALSKFVFDGGEYRVFTEYSEWCGEGMGRWQELVTEISASNDDIRTNVMSTPFVGIYNVQTGRGVAFHILAENTWCYRVRKFYSAEGHRKVITVELGIRERGFSYDLGALEKWMTIRSLTPFTPVYGGGECEKILPRGDAAWGHMEVLDKSFLCAAALGGPLGISCDLVRLFDETKDMLATMIRQFKQDRNFWASSECRILTDTESMLVLAFSDAEFTDVRVHAYVKVPHQNTLTVYPEVMPNATYAVGDATLTGEGILRDGIEMSVGARYTANTPQLKRV